MLCSDRLGAKFSTIHNMFRYKPSCFIKVQIQPNLVKYFWPQIAALITEQSLPQISAQELKLRTLDITVCTEISRSVRQQNVLCLKGIISDDNFLGHLCISNDKSESDGSNWMTSELRFLDYYRLTLILAALRFRLYSNYKLPTKRHRYKILKCNFSSDSSRQVWQLMICDCCTITTYPSLIYNHPSIHLSSINSSVTALLSRLPADLSGLFALTAWLICL